MTEPHSHPTNSIPLFGKISAALSGVVHVYFYYMESLNWLDPNVYEVFQVSSLADAEVMDLYVKNQGYYNLFLALGMFAGLALLRKFPTVAKTLIGYISAVMVGAAVVLLFTISGMIRGVVLQGLPAAVTLASLALARSSEAADL